MTNLPRDIEIELAALADGTLTGAAREQALARVKDSPDLLAALAEQQRVIELTAAVDVRAPQSLHRQVEAMLAQDGPGARDAHGAEHPQHPRRRSLRTQARRPSFGFARRWRIGFAAVATIALLAAVVAISSTGGHSGSPGLSVQQTAALTLSPATGPAPGENEQHRSQLTVAVGGVAFPYWKERFGWRSSGTRKDELDGRTVTTVFYADGQGRRVGYAIASGQAPRTSGGTVVRHWGVSYRLLSHDGSTVVTWQRAGHLCVIAGRGVSARTLLSLASWGSERPHAA
jgi:hypothetical protein